MVQGFSRRWPQSGLALTCLTLLAGLAGAQCVSAQTIVVAAAALPDPVAGTDPARTRFVIGLDKPAQFQVFSLGNPNRVIVDLPDVRMQLPAQDSSGKPTGLVKSFRAGLSAPGKSRIVIDVTAPVIVESAKIETAKDGKSQRLALEIIPADGAKPNARRMLRQSPPSGLGAAGIQPPLPKPAVKPRERAASAFKQVIVIDPGHGGHDSGAQKFGTIEKDVVLAFGKALRDKLEATGRYKILMTRDHDKFVDLDERRAFGERNHAALFIAVHADYASTKASGATIYSLRDSVAKELKQSAKGDVTEKVLSPKEVEKVKAASGDLGAIKSILSDLAVREVDATKERTSVFTRAVIEEMGASTSMRDDPDKQAAFRVLKTAQFPSVLIELAYVSNRQDAQNLKSDTWRDKVADSIVTAVDNYFSHQLARLPM
ncbi:MAG: N-acetylmuramoyl-L-alanine amidase [Hyphomicrobium sp.]